MRARVVTVIIGLIMLAAVFWIGVTLADLKLAALATLVVGSTWFFQRQARTASYDIHVAAWATLAVAAALWAVRPRGAAPGRARSWLGWGLCTFAMILGCYGKNPLPVGLAVIPLAGAAVLWRERRKAIIVGTLVSAVISVGAVAVWYGWALRGNPELIRDLQHEFSQPRGKDAQPIWYYVGIFGLVLPWTIWLISGLAHPFTGLARHWKRMLLLGLVWFVGLFVAMSLVEAKQQRYILPIVPAVALLVAGVWCDHARAAAQGERPGPIYPFIWLHWLVIGVVTLGFGVALADGPAVAEWLGGFRQDDAAGEPILDSIGLVPAILVTVALLGVAGYGFVQHLRWRPYPAAICCGLWMLGLLAVAWPAYGLAPSGRHLMRPIAADFRAVVGDAPITSLRLTDEDTFRVAPQ